MTLILVIEEPDKLLVEVALTCMLFESEKESEEENRAKFEVGLAFVKLVEAA